MIANPYLIAYWKYIWIIYHHGTLTRSPEFLEDDYFLLNENSGIGVEYLKKVLRADKTLYSYKESTLDKLCVALNKFIPNFPSSWDMLTTLSITKKIYVESQYLCLIKNLSFKIEELNKAIASRIYNQAFTDAMQFLSLTKVELTVPVVRTIPRREYKLLLSGMTNPIKIADEDDIYKIYEFAQDRYGDCPLNGPEIKLPWWKKNSSIFYVIHDTQGNVCANLNLLPLTEDCYNKIRNGYICESDITANDIYSESQNEKVKYIFVEGFNCSKVRHLKEFVKLFDVILYNLVGIYRDDLVIGAIGGSAHGERLMEDLGFLIFTNYKNRLDHYNFFEVKYHDAIQYFSFRQKKRCFLNEKHIFQDGALVNAPKD